MGFGSGVSKGSAMTDETEIPHGAIRTDAGVGAWTPPGARERQRILQETKTVAMVGASTNPARPAYFVATYLLASSNYDVYFVNPSGGEIMGRPVYPSLEAIGIVPDMVDVFRRSTDLPGVLDEALKIGTKTFWVQLGLWHDDVARVGHEAGLNVVMNRCLKIEHARFAGGLHRAGFDTGVISSRKGTL